MADYNITVGKDGKRRFKPPGWVGWPLIMLDGETPEETLSRYESNKRDKEAATINLDSPVSQTSPERPPGEGGGPAGHEGSAPPPRPSRPRDPAPRARQTGASGKSHPTTAELEGVLRELLVMPAIPARGLLGCEYCMNHFLKEGPQAAHELAIMSESNKGLRDLLERLHGAMTAITWASVLGGYVAKPLLHHAAPAPVRVTYGGIVGVPPNRKDQQRAEQERARHAAAQAAAPPRGAAEQSIPTERAAS